MRSRRAAVTFSLVALLLAGLAGCGGGGGGTDKAQALLKETFGPGHPIRSGRLSLSLHVTGSGAGLKAPIALELAGPFVSVRPGRLPNFALRARIGDTGQAAAGLLSTGKQGFVTVGDQAFVLSDEAYRQLQERYRKTQQQDQAQRKDAPGLSALGIHPADWLTDATTSEDADVAGTPTTRVSGALNADALLADIDRLLAQSGGVPQTASTAKLPKRLEPEVRKALRRSITTAKVSVDAGRSDRTLRRITLRLIMAVAPEDQKTLGGLRKLDVDLDLAIADLGKVQKIPTPKNARPLSQLGAALSAAAPSQAPKSPAATTTTPSTTGSATQRYTDCLRKAGDDVGAIQQCADIINR